MAKEYKISKSNKKDKKWMVTTPEGRIIHFGASGYEDYTIHKDRARWQRYKARHSSNEDWNKSGINTPGFWSRWILWNKPSFRDSVKNTEKKFNIKIKWA